MFSVFKRKAKPRLYSKCNELVLHHFEECMNGNLDYLKINPSDKVKQSDIENAWLSIVDEFLILSKNKITLNIIKKKNKVLLLESRLRVLEVLNFCVDREINVEDKLIEYKTSKEKINIHIAMAKNDIARLTSRDYQEEENNISFDFSTSIAVLSKNGFQINRFTTVVSEWCAFLNLLEKQKEADKLN